MRRTIFDFACLIAAAVINAQPVDERPAPTLEAYPERVLARIEARDRQLRQVAPRGIGGATFEQVVQTVGRWKPGSTVTVAFYGGGPALHRDIANVAREWTRPGRANLKLDFGDEANGQFRQWTPNDATFNADVRIAFHENGYWSYVGADSINTAVVKPNEPSMSLAAFHVQRPLDWQGVVIHEFGHALGFWHEHQHPQQPCDFRWNDDPGYIATVDGFGQYIRDPAGRRPGLYTVLGGPPNEWPRWKVDANLAAITTSHMFDVSPFDNASIMKYSFDGWMFVSGTSSHCYSTTDNNQLSPRDIEAVRRAYPMDVAQIQQFLTRQLRFVNELLGAGRLQLDAKAGLQDRLNRLKSSG